MGAHQSASGSRALLASAAAAWSSLSLQPFVERVEAQPTFEIDQVVKLRYCERNCSGQSVGWDVINASSGQGFIPALGTGSVNSQDMSLAAGFSSGGAVGLRATGRIVGLPSEYSGSLELTAFGNVERVVGTINGTTVAIDPEERVVPFFSAGSSVEFVIDLRGSITEVGVNPPPDAIVSGSFSLALPQVDGVVRNTDDFSPINGAVVTGYGDLAVTDSHGLFSLVPTNLSSSEVIVTADGFCTRVVSLEPRTENSSESLVLLSPSVDAGVYPILSQSREVYISGISEQARAEALVGWGSAPPGDVLFSFERNGEVVGVYEGVQGSDGCGTYSTNFDPATIPGGSRLHVTAIDGMGITVGTAEANIFVAPPPPSYAASEFSRSMGSTREYKHNLGDISFALGISGADEATIPQASEFLAGASFGFEFPATLAGKINDRGRFSLRAPTVSGGFVTPKIPGMPSAQVQASSAASIFMEYRDSAGEWVADGGSVRISLSGSATTPDIPIAVPFLPVISPLNLTLGLGVGGAIDLGVSASETGRLFDAFGTISLDKVPEFSVQVSRRVAPAVELGVFGRGRLGLTYEFERGSDEVNMVAAQFGYTVGAKIQLWSFVDLDAQISDSFDLLSSNRSVLPIEIPPVVHSPMRVRSMPDLSRRTDIGGVVSSSARLGERSAKLDRSSIALVDSTSRALRPQFVSTGSVGLAVWIELDATRDSIDASRLMYSRFDPFAVDGGDVMWSPPRPVLDDGTADHSPVLVTDGFGQTVLAWEDPGVIIGDPNDPTDVESVVDKFQEFKSKLGINVAVYDEFTDSWSFDRRFDTPGVLDRSPALAIDSFSGDTSLVWIVNEGNEEFGTSESPNIIRHAEKRFGGWGQVNDVAQDVAHIGTAVVGRVDGVVQIVYVSDDDGDLTETSDSDLVFIRRDLGGAWGELITLTTPSVSDTDPSIGVNGDGEWLLLWQRGDDIVIADGDGFDGSVTVIGDSVGLGSALYAPRLSMPVFGPPVIGWLGVRSANTKVWASVFDQYGTGEWTGAIPLGEDGIADSDLSVAFDPIGNLVALTERPFEGEQGDELADLVVTTLDRDVSIEDVAVELVRDAGGAVVDLVVAATVSNPGDRVVGGPLFATVYTAGRDQVLGSLVEPSVIPAATNRSVSIPISAPMADQSSVAFLVIEGAGIGQVEIPLPLIDTEAVRLSRFSVTAQADEQAVFLTGAIENSSALGLGSLQIAVEDLLGSVVLASAVVPSVGAGSTRDLSLQLPMRAGFDLENDRVRITVSQQAGGVFIVDTVVPLLVVDDAGQCPSDLDGDGLSTVFDLILFLQSFSPGEFNSVADRDLDGDVDVFDLIEFLVSFSQGCSAV